MNNVRLGQLNVGQDTPKTVVPCAAATQEEIVQLAQDAVAEGADIIEWRADAASFLDDEQAVVACARNIQHACAPAPLIVTVRTEGNTALSLSVARYEQILMAVIQAKAADAIDIELSLDAACVHRLIAGAHAQGVVVIASYHDFETTPTLLQIRGLFAQMQAEGADIGKVAAMASTFAEAQRMMAATSAFASSADAIPVVGIAMGEEGALSRVTGELFGSALTFASCKNISAPGQLSLSQTKGFMAKLHEASQEHLFTELRSVNVLRERMNQVALLGSPVGHSLSPAIHNLSFSYAGIDALYASLDCEKSQIGEAIAALKANPSWVGANVTMPCKQEVIKHLDGLDDAAMLIGAVNTVAIRDGRAIGYNTDGVGFVESLRAAGADVRNQKVYVMGGGGAASAVVVQCALEGATSIDVMCRLESTRRKDMEQLASRVFEQTGCAINVLVYADVNDLAMIVAGADILVNATPVGMGESAHETPVPSHMFHSEMVVADLVYFPQRTRLLEEAAMKGATTISGLGMLLYQAAEAERIWFDIEMDVNTIANELFGVL